MAEENPKSENWITELSADAIQTFVISREHDDERTWVLKSKLIEGVPSSLVANQMAGRRKARTKLPTWYQTKGIVYPPSLNLEQSSSEATGLLKQQIVKAILPDGKNLSGADLTGGFGVDSFFLSPLFADFHSIEPDKNVLSFAQHNHRVLGNLSIQYHQQTAEDYLQTMSSLDLIFIDPSRRNESQKVFKLSDCIPNVVLLQEILLEKSKSVLIKCSPMLDIQQGLAQLKNVKMIWVVSVSNECKEILFLLDRVSAEEPRIEAIELSSRGEVKESFSFHLSEEQKASSSFSQPQEYLYEPNAAIMKAGAFKWIGEKMGVFKIDQHTHVYTSSTLIDSFPGRIFKVLKSDATESDFKLLPDRKANVITRNYPLSAEVLKKKLKIKDGGEHYIIGYSQANKKFISLATRVK